MEKDAPLTVVIVGGGPAGATVANHLSSHLRVVMVEPRESFWCQYGGVRGYVSPEYGKQLLVPYPKDYEHLVDRVTGIDEKEHLLHTEKTGDLRYDACVLATGTSYRAPFKFQSGSDEEIRGELERLGEQLAQVGSVCVVGGGAVGVETALEIRSKHRDMSVTLIHSHPELCTGAGNARFRPRLAQKLQDRGVEVVLNARVTGGLPLEEEKGVLFGEFTLQLSNSQELNTECVVVCIGSKPNSEAFTHLTNEQGFVPVNRHMQVGDHSNLFACGDICETPGGSPKLGFIAERFHGPLVAKNVQAVLKGKTWLSSLHLPPVDIFGVSLGPDATFFSLGPVCIENMMMDKAHDLFLAKTKSLYL